MFLFCVADNGAFHLPRKSKLGDGIDIKSVKKNGKPESDATRQVDFLAAPVYKQHITWYFTHNMIVATHLWAVVRQFYVYELLKLTQKTQVLEKL